MKSIWIAPLALTLAACGQTETAPDIGAANAAVVNGMYAAFAEGDAGAVLAALDEDIVWNEAENFPYGDRNPYEGPDAVAEGVFGRIATEWDFWTLDVQEVLTSGDDRVVALGRYNARHSETGVEIDIQFAHVWTIEDGKATVFQQYADTYQAMMAMPGYADVESGDGEDG